MPCLACACGASRGRPAGCYPARLAALDGAWFAREASDLETARLGGGGPVVALGQALPPPERCATSPRSRAGRSAIRPS